MIYQKRKAFTLVELIVVVTILAVLATIWFVSYSSYLVWVRDTNRISQLVSISDGLQLYSTRNNLPLPDDNVEIYVEDTPEDTLIAYQWKVWANVLETIDFTKGWVDPRDGEYFSYYLTRDRKKYQLMAFLEDDESNLTSWVFEETRAASYENRVPTVAWKKLWILTTLENTPVEDDGTTVILSDTTDEFIAHIDSETQIVGATTESPLQYMGEIAVSWWVGKSCKTLMDRNGALRWKNGTYVIDPEWWNPFPVYCDMSTDWGGWTRLSLLTREWGSNQGWSSDPIESSYWTRVEGTGTQQELNNFIDCVWDSQVDLIWENEGEQLDEILINTFNNIFSEWFTSQYAAFDTDSYDHWDSWKGCYDDRILAYADGDEFWRWGDMNWVTSLEVDEIKWIFTKGIYGGNAQNNWYNISLPRYWYFR